LYARLLCYGCMQRFVSVWLSVPVQSIVLAVTCWQYEFRLTNVSRHCRMICTQCMICWIMWLSLRPVLVNYVIVFEASTGELCDCLYWWNMWVSLRPVLVNYVIVFEASTAISCDCVFIRLWCHMPRHCRQIHCCHMPRHCRQIHCWLKSWRRSASSPIDERSSLISFCIPRWHLCYSIYCMYCITWVGGFITECTLAVAHVCFTTGNRANIATIMCIQ